MLFEYQKKIVESYGFQVVVIQECEWNFLKKNDENVAAFMTHEFQSRSLKRLNPRLENVCLNF